MLLLLNAHGTTAATNQRISCAAHTTRSAAADFDGAPHVFQLMTSEPERNYPATLLDAYSLSSTQALADVPRRREEAAGVVVWGGLTIAVRAAIALNARRTCGCCDCAAAPPPGRFSVADAAHHRPCVVSQPNDAVRNLTRVASFAAASINWRDPVTNATADRDSGGVLVMFNWDTVRTFFSFQAACIRQSQMQQRSSECALRVSDCERSLSAAAVLRRTTTRFLRRRSRRRRRRRWCSAARSQRRRRCSRTSR